MTDDEWNQRVERARQKVHDCAGDLVVALLGEPASRSRSNVRYGNKGGLSIAIAGDKAGMWYRHDEGRGKDFFVLVQDHLGCDFKEALEWVETTAGLPAMEQTETSSAASSKLRGSEKVDFILSRCRPIAGTVVEAYLRFRGCAVPKEGALRYLPASEKYPWPAMVGIVTDFATHERLTLHITSLAKDGRGKAPLERPRNLLKDHEKRCGVIRLTPDADVEERLGLAEGIETALTITAALGKTAHWLPTWSAIDAGNLRRLPVLGGIRQLTIFIDRDPPKFEERGGRMVNVGEAGQRAGYELAARWRQAKRQVFIASPPASAGPKADWNDVGQAA
jgi:putative DNA primase/helicase